MALDHSPELWHVQPRRTALLTAVTLALAAGTAWLVARSNPDFEEVISPVQLAVSVVVPFVGVLLVTDLHQPTAWPDARLGRRLGAALSLAVGLAVAGLVIAAVATALGGGSWPTAARTAALAWGAVLVQVIAQSTGTAWGLLVRRPPLAMAATIVVPMSVTTLLGAVDPGGGSAHWLTLYANATSLLSGTVFPAPLPVVVLLWCVVPNVLGWHLRRRVALRSSEQPRTT